MPLQLSSAVSSIANRVGVKCHANLLVCRGDLLVWGLTAISVLDVLSGPEVRHRRCGLWNFHDRASVWFIRRSSHDTTSVSPIRRPSHAPLRSLPNRIDHDRSHWSFPASAHRQLEGVYLRVRPDSGRIAPEVGDCKDAGKVYRAICPVTEAGSRQSLQNGRELIVGGYSGPRKGTLASYRLPGMPGRRL